MVEAIASNLLHEPAVAGIVVNSRDITERKRTEKLLRKSEERLNLVLDATNQGLWDWSIPTGEIYFSPRYFTMLGYEPDEFPACFESFRNLVHPDDLPKIPETLETFAETGGKTSEIEFRLKNKQGGWCWILSRSKVVEHDAEGRAVRMVGTHTDITERRRLDEQFLRAQKLQTIGTLASGVAHDLNNILTPILMVRGILPDTLNSPEVEQFIAMIETSARRGAEIVGNG